MKIYDLKYLFNFMEVNSNDIKKQNKCPKSPNTDSLAAMVQSSYIDRVLVKRVDLGLLVSV